MNNAKNTHLSWVDIETTGFTELSKNMVHKHKILEVGLVVTDQDFNVVDKISVVIGHNRQEAMRWADDYVINMHTKNGLWDECEKSTLSIKDAEVKLLEFIVKNGVGRFESPMWGNSVYLDRAFLEAQMPEFASYFHFRNGDLSAVKEFLKLISPDFEPIKASGHRALDDIYESINEAKLYRSLIKPGLDKILEARAAAPQTADDSLDEPHYY